jgi:hypothetical protein
LLKRLRASGNPVGWVLTQVWDRFVDRPFFCSQQAIRTVRDECDVVLYLVNAAEDPSALAYIEAELEILRWMDKPVLLLLNQTGPPRAPEAEAAEEARWARRLAAHVREHAVITMDAFARCWVQEDRLLGAAAALLPPAMHAQAGRLRAAWRARNLEVFNASMRRLARNLAMAAGDRETIAETLDAASIAARMKRFVSRAKDGDRDPSLERPMGALSNRLDERLRADTEALIGMHGLTGRAKEQVLQRAGAFFEVDRGVDVGGTGILGGALSGAAGGLAADLSAGGLSMGAGMLIGAIVGAVGASGLAKAYNVLQGQDDGRVRWSAEFLVQRVRALVLLYLAIAHYGRGRGEWVQGEAPDHWPPLVDEVVDKRRDALERALRSTAEAVPADELAASLEPEMAAIVREVLGRLYPEARAIF